MGGLRKRTEKKIVLWKSNVHKKSFWQQKVKEIT